MKNLVQAPPEIATTHARFIHISDLHIGTLDKDGDATTTGQAQFIYENNSVFDGLLGHSFTSLTQLEEFFDSANALKPSAEVILTGDITRCGAKTEFENAEKYFTDEITGSQTLTPAGLYLGAKPDHWIHGNHDQWGGDNYWPPMTPSISQTACWKKTFPSVSIKHLTPTIDLIFTSIDTDADVAHYSFERFAARGDFMSQLRLADLMIKAAMVRVSSLGRQYINILLLHHSYETKTLALGMRSGSREALEDLIVARNIKFMLSGHAHAPSNQLFNITSGGVTTDVREIRCGTTTQHDVVPSRWQPPRWRPPQRSWPPNSLFVHTIGVDKISNQLIWIAEPYWRVPGSGFEPSNVANLRTITLL